MILLLFIICIVNLITFYNVDYKYYKEHGEWKIILIHTVEHLEI